MFFEMSEESSEDYTLLRGLPPLPAGSHRFIYAVDLHPQSDGRISLEIFRRDMPLISNSSSVDEHHGIGVQSPALEDNGSNLMRGSLSADDAAEETLGALYSSAGPTPRNLNLEDVTIPADERIHFNVHPSSSGGMTAGLFSRHFISAFSMELLSEITEEMERARLMELPRHAYKARVDDELIRDASRAACAICLVEFHAGELVSFTFCDHFFHTPCLDTWLESNRSCPYCRSFV